jgi:hypothetical protein
VLTDRRLIIMEGFVKPVDRAMRLSDLKSITVQQDAMGRSMDFGKVEVELRNGEKRSLKPLAEAAKFVNWVKQVADPNSEASGPRDEAEAAPSWSVTGDSPLASTEKPA